MDPEYVKLNDLNPFEDTNEIRSRDYEDDVESSSPKANQWSLRKKLKLCGSIIGGCLLFLLFLLFLKNKDTDLREASTAANQEKQNYRLSPAGSKSSGFDEEGIVNLAQEGSEKEDKTSWRLDTANNYTSDLNYWRNDYNKQKERHYFFNITNILKVDANGAIRNLTVINGQYPGPLLEANSGDTIFLHVFNQMEDEPVSFHLHGLFYPNNTFDDGASSINVCPIPPSGNYTYRIPVGENEYGTYWYHSHWSTQYADGVYGPVILHSPKEDANLTSYDADRIYVVNDYYYENADTLLDDYLVPDNENSEPNPDAGLISGTYSQASNYLTLADNGTAYKTATYYDPKLTYRIRVANVGFFLPFEFSSDEHTLSLVEVEGTLIEPFETSYVDVSVGERYSFFVKRTVERDAYWIHARFNTFCQASNNPDFSSDVMAIVSYNDTYSVPESKETWSYNGGTPKCLDFPQSELRTLNAQVPINKNGSNRPDLYVELDVTFFNGAYQMTYGYFNEYTWKPMSNSSTMHELLFNENFQNDAHKSNQQTFTNNQYVLNFDTRGMIVDLLINNFDDGSHPFHLHGYKFWVLASSESGSFYPSFYEDHPERLDLTNPILRDTVSVAPFGFAVLRVVIDNPGIFPFHCHIGWHIEAGLLLTVNALQSEWSHQNYSKEWANMCGYDFADPYLVATEIN